MAHGLRQGVALLVPRTSARGSERNRCSSHWLRGTIKGAIRRSRPVCPLPRQNPSESTSSHRDRFAHGERRSRRTGYSSWTRLGDLGRTLWASTVGPRWPLATYRGSLDGSIAYYLTPSISMERARKAQERIKDLHDIGDEEAARELTVSYLTHRSWASLAQAGVHPQSRPELPRQLRGVGEADLACHARTGSIGKERRYVVTRLALPRESWIPIHRS